jgi:dienelactone hydrolase
MTSAAVLMALLSVAPMSVDIRSADGFILKGSYFSPGQAGPGIVLFHQCDSDRQVWSRLAADLVGVGFHVLTFDSRGFGQSTGGGRLTVEKIDADVDAAYNWLAAQPTVDRARLAAGGGSCGVTQAGTVAAMHHEVRALLLLSGALSSRATKYATTAPGLAIFAASGQRDPSSGNALAVARTSRNPRSIATEYADAAHGVRMFTAHRELEPAIVQWLQTVMK